MASVSIKSAMFIADIDDPLNGQYHRIRSFS